MPINESKRKTRERWPLAFDLEGEPRDTATRQKRLELERALETEETETMKGPNLVTNSFAVDYSAGPVVTDLNNPPHKNTPYQPYPRMMYPPNWPAAKPVKVEGKEQEDLYLKKKFTLKPPVKPAAEQESA